MLELKVRVCQCRSCRQELDLRDKELHELMNLFLSRLDEQQRRWYAGLQAKWMGHGGIRLMSQITGLDEKTIRRGGQELASGLASRSTDRVRLPGGGRPSVKKNP